MMFLGNARSLVVHLDDDFIIRFQAYNTHG